VFSGEKLKGGKKMKNKKVKTVKVLLHKAKELMEEAGCYSLAGFRFRGKLYEIKLDSPLPCIKEVVLSETGYYRPVEGEIDPAILHRLLQSWCTFLRRRIENRRNTVPDFEETGAEAGTENAPSHESGSRFGGEIHHGGEAGEEGAVQLPNKGSCEAPQGKEAAQEKSNSVAGGSENAGNLSQHEKSDSGAVDVSPAGGSENANEPQSAESSPDQLGGKQAGRMFSIGKGKKASGASAQAAQHHGGIYGALEEITERPTALLKRVRRAFAMLRNFEGSADQSPRYDWEKFCVRLKTAQSYQKARKEEQGQGNILVLVDVSGSCSGFCHKSLTVAKVAQLVGESTAIMVHSNGYVEELFENGGRKQNLAEKNLSAREVIEFIDSYIRQRDISIVVALGDWDAEWLYQHISQNERIKALIWLDVYDCRRITPDPVYAFGRKFRNARLCPDAKLHPRTIYIIACQTAEDFAFGLELGIKVLKMVANS
jgi:hypothetical protein